MTKSLSDKIKIISFICIIFVLYIHSGFKPRGLEDLEILNFTQIFISGMLGRCAVPMFFVISGYLYFQNSNSIQSIFLKIKKRVKTLFIPYLASSIFFIVFFISVELIPGTSKFMNFKLMPLFDDQWYNILYRIFIDFGNGSPIAFQLWFLRDLIVIVLFSPLLFFAYRYIKWTWLMISLIAYFYFDQQTFLSFFWFGIGGSFQLYKVDVSINKPIKIIIISLFILLSFIEIFYNGLYEWKYFQIPIVSMGVLSMWFIYDSLVNAKFNLEENLVLNVAVSFTFFIYLFHEPVLNVVRKIIVHIIGKIEIGYIISYLLSPWIFIFMAIITGIGLKRYFSKLYSVLVGGRV